MCWVTIPWCSVSKGNACLWQDENKMYKALIFNP